MYHTQNLDLPLGCFKSLYGVGWWGEEMAHQVQVLTVQT